MAYLFKNKALKEELRNYCVPDFEAKLAIINQWLDAHRSGKLADKTESQCEQAFNSDFFEKILGYTAFPNNMYTLEPKTTTDASGQKPDATLGYYDDETKRTIAVVEIKNAKTPLDKSQQREGNLSPVQQAFKYKPQFKNCPFVIATNFVEIRLLRDNQLDFESFTLESLADSSDDYFEFKKFYYLLCAENFVCKSGTTKTEGILGSIRREEEQITKKFYKEYKELRKELVADIQANNTISDFTVIVEHAQKIIDRIVFICFCEDLGLIPEDKLIEVIEYAEKMGLTIPIWQIMQGFFTAIDKGSEKLGIPFGYNGELFKEDGKLNALKISDDICKKFADFGKYDFAEDLRVNILGHIFEQSISDIEEMKETENVQKGIVSKRKKDGIFYTPEYIVDYIVTHSLGTYLQEKERAALERNGVKEDLQDKNYEKRMKKAYLEYWEELKNVKILDPACGSGAFLVRVFDFLLAEHQRVGDILGLNKGVADFTTVYKSILEKNIYGVDLNPESVEITKLSLWLKTAMKGKKLTNLKENIKCGNSLIDDKDVAGERAFVWEEEFKEIMESGGFNVVIGNPPYGAAMSEKDKKYYLIDYQTAYYKLDTYALFIEKGITLLKEGGYISYILPYTWLTIKQHCKLREHILNYNLINILDLPQKIFDDADLDTMIFTLSKASPSPFINIGKVDKQFNIQYSTLSLEHIQANEDLLINCNYSNKDAELIKKIKKESRLLSEYFEVSQGYIPYRRSDLIIKYGIEKGNQIVDERLWHSDVKIDDDWKLEIQGRDLGRYKNLEPSKYIKYGKHVAGYVNEKFFNQPRVLIMEVTRGIKYKLSAQYVEKEYYNTPSIINIISQNNSKYGLYPVLAIINSALITWWHVKKHAKANATTSIPKILVGDVKNLPLTIKFNNEKLASMAKLMLNLISQLDDKLSQINKLLIYEYHIEQPSKKLQSFWKLDFDDFTKELKVKNLSLEKKEVLLNFFEKKKAEVLQLKQQIDDLDKEIDEMVFDLYGLTEEERKIVLNYS
jgi:hypothetical protein